MFGQRDVAATFYILRICIQELLGTKGHMLLLCSQSSSDSIFRCLMHVLLQGISLSLFLFTVVALA